MFVRFRPTQYKQVIRLPRRRLKAKNRAPSPAEIIEISSGYVILFLKKNNNINVKFNVLRLCPQCFVHQGRRHNDFETKGTVTNEEET